MMNKLKKILASPGVTVGAFVLAAALLGFSTIGGARAALTYYSDNYVSTVQLQEIGVQLIENGAIVAQGNAAAASRGSGNTLLGTMYLNGSTTPEDPAAAFKPGALYREVLAVQNPAAAQTEGAETITHYVRVSIYRYWERQTADGQWVKDPSLNPALIRLNLLTGNGWVEDVSARTDERTVLYYTLPLAPGETTSAFSDTLMIAPEVATSVSGSGTTTTYLYDDAGFQLMVQVDAVQDHNAQNAILSAWGRKVTIAGDGTLSLG